jgi:CDP-glycerol glycerophosphotransferase
MNTVRDSTARAAERLSKSPIIRTCVRTLYVFLRLVVPTDPKRIAFVSHPDCADNAYALFERVMESPVARDYRLLWLAQDAEFAEGVLRRDFPGFGPAHLKVVSKNTLRGLFWFLRSRYVFFTAGVYWFVSSGHHQTIVNLWHGMPIKSIGTFDAREFSQPQFAHYSVASSDYWAGLVAQAFSMPRERVLVTGLPRNKWLLQPDPRHAALREGRSRLVVWLPTFRQWEDGRRAWRDTAVDVPDPISVETLPSLDELLDGFDTQLVLKFHPGDARKLQPWPACKNIRVFTDQAFRDERLNVYKLLACSDALVTDYSSIAIDYLLLRKPIGFFAPDVSAYARGFMPGVWERLASLGPQLASLEELAAFVRSPSPLPPTTPEIEDLHRHDLREPSAAVLRAVGLGALLPAPSGTEASPHRSSVADEKNRVVGAQSLVG